MITINCKICNREFLNEAKFTNRKFCDSCRYKKCKICSKLFLSKPFAKKKRVFCSKECNWYSKVGIPRDKEHVSKTAKSNTGRKSGYYIDCLMCGKKAYRYQSRKDKNRKWNFCSKICFSKFSKSSDNPNWKGDDYPENKRLRDSLRYKKWRKYVFLRDNFTCVLCGYKSKGIKPPDINADHIKSWALFESLRFDISNGRTLCIPCHHKTESWGINAKFQKLSQ